MHTTAEHLRLQEHHDRKANWRKWGPYTSERAWGTVREDYSVDGNAWDYVTHDQARSKVYRWNEDGLGGICDRDQFLCLAFGLWNGKDPILKERLFGLTNTEGNHGEDVKEYYFYLDNTPTHSYMKMLYKYPQGRYPYEELVQENARRGYFDPEYELMDSGLFDEHRYFDVVFEYAKADQEDLLIQVTVINRGPEPAEIMILPQAWFRNVWSWGYERGPTGRVPGKPSMEERDGALFTTHPTLGDFYLYAEGTPEWLLTENETNRQRLYNYPNTTPFVKDAFHRYVVNGELGAVNPEKVGTKAAACYRVAVADRTTLRLRLVKEGMAQPFEDFDAQVSQRKSEADAFYETVHAPNLSEEERKVQRQALAGMLWTKQFYYYDMEQWLGGDCGEPMPPTARRHGRNSNWEHLVNFDVISVCDKWEYPWYATWDLAFHALALILVDPDFVKRQLILMTREWYMHPNGQLPAYEWEFGDVNPPVHAWAAWRVYKIDAKRSGTPDRSFLVAIFQKLLLNFTWWVNRKDAQGRNIFQGGFLGMDNISVFDRSRPLPTGGFMDQSDGTAWMGFFCLGMMQIALELAKQEPTYQDSASKFFEHFLRIAHAMTERGHLGTALWDEEDHFFYDVLHMPNGQPTPLRVRSMVGLLPLLAVETIDDDLLTSMPIFARRLKWFVRQRPHLAGNMARCDVCGSSQRRLVAILTEDRLRCVLRYMLDESEFLSPYGIRSVSRYHEEHPYSFNADGRQFAINYEPAESESGLFGGNSNWRGPIWFPVNFLIIESLQKFHHYLGDDWKVECPTGSGNMMNLWDVAEEISTRLMRIFLPDATGHRPVFGEQKLFQKDAHWRDYLLFHEYFHGDTGRGLGASHQTGWTGVVAKLIQQSGGKL